MKNKKPKPQPSNEDYRLVYSTDPIPKPSSSAEAMPSGPLKPVVQIERKGRNGKTVTIISKLPAHDAFLKDLCASLKRSLGSGGSYAIAEEHGVIEIQGDRREQVLQLVEEYSKKMKK